MCVLISTKPTKYFLPFCCDYCHRDFCLEHHSPVIHHCDALQNKPAGKKTSTTESLKQKCCVKTCNQKELISVTCNFCGEIVCLHHRHQVDHSCVKIVSPEEPMKKTTELVRNILESKHAQPQKKALQGRKSASTAAKVQLMKLKMKAVGDNSLPQTERIYFQVFLPKRHTNKEKAFYFSKLWTVGKLVDTVACQEKLPNKNNIANMEWLKLFSTSDGRCFSMADTLSSLLENDVLCSGNSIILEYVAPGTEFLESFSSYQA
ncbi:AN1-type zinc finger protein 1-like isoform X2 [Tachypleus tridentatus]|uniref:AN1-type zinc finger protein 1-like isoform X2 n=1 Tax=Tachypleus tridentatus TaxID=6853 RepID=UPI003FCF2B11